VTSRDSPLYLRTCIHFHCCQRWAAVQALTADIFASNTQKFNFSGFSQLNLSNDRQRLFASHLFSPQQRFTITMADPYVTPAPGHTRRLVTVRQVSDKENFKGVTFIHLDGWTVYAPKNMYQLGDYVVYFEIDSFLPASDGRYWEFMTPGRTTTLNGKKGYRISSARVGPKLSQGYAFQLREFPEIQAILNNLIKSHGEEEAYRRIMDMSFEKMLGIEKWVAEMDYSDRASIGKPPAFILQPAWERCQNIRNLFRQRQHTNFQITEKLDGLSMSVYLVRRGSR
jgi:hypothetical protein